MGSMIQIGGQIDCAPRVLAPDRDIAHCTGFARVCVAVTSNRGERSYPLNDNNERSGKVPKRVVPR